MWLRFISLRGKRGGCVYFRTGLPVELQREPAFVLRRRAEGTTGRGSGVCPWSGREVVTQTPTTQSKRSDDPAALEATSESEPGPARHGGAGPLPVVPRKDPLASGGSTWGRRLRVRTLPIGQVMVRGTEFVYRDRFLYLRLNT